VPELRILLVTPAPRGSRKGNRVTALRWARLLRGLGHRVAVREEHRGGSFDLLIALHALRSAPSVERFRREHPGRPVVAALTGTDIYRDLPGSPEARRALEGAEVIVALQPLALEALPQSLRGKTRTIIQSAEPPRRRPGPRRGLFEVCVLGHLREVKDPFRAAEAARLLPPSSRIRVLHLGGALEAEMARRARAEERANPRYRWRGELPRARALEVLARSRLLVLSSRLEGGANAVSEALAASVPVLSSRIPGSVGLLGEDYPGFFPVGDTRALAALLERAESDRGFYRELRRRCRRLRPLVDPARERRAWAGLLRQISARYPSPRQRPQPRASSLAASPAGTRTR
jgi:putative glycosyltransferase (TIGR04348 family)